MSLQSTAIFDRRVYASDSAPDDERDGVLWVDTSAASRPLYVYSSETAAWELASPEGIAVQDTEPDAPNLGDGWIDTSQDPPRLKIYDGTDWSVSGQTGDLALDDTATYTANGDGSTYVAGNAGKCTVAVLHVLVELEVVARNESGSGGYPNVGFRLVDSDDGTVVFDAGSILMINDETLQTWRESHRFTVSEVSNNLVNPHGRNLRAEFYDEAGGGGSNDRIEEQYYRVHFGGSA